jgi:hypothetical protein
MLFKEIIAVYPENYMKLMNTVCVHNAESLDIAVHVNE